MVALIGRHKGIRLRAMKLERLFPRDEDMTRPLVARMCQVLQSTDPFIAGEIAHASGGLALADRLTGNERIWLVGTSLLRSSITDAMDARSSRLWAPIDLAATAARALMRLVARDSLSNLDSRPILFITGPRQVSQVEEVIDDEPLEVIDLRRESKPQGFRAVIRALSGSWKSTEGLAFDARIRLARLRFEAEPIAQIVEHLHANGVRRVYFGDITGHRARLCAELSVQAGVETIVIQHGLIANPCPYLPPAGVTFVAWSEDDLGWLKSLMKDSSVVDWRLAQRETRSIPRTGKGILVCPSLIGSLERFNALQASIREARSLSSEVAVRFHPSERFQWLKAQRLGVQHMSSVTPLAEIDLLWGRAIAPFVSSVRDDLVRHGFTVLDLPAGRDR